MKHYFRLHLAKDGYTTWKVECSDSQRCDEGSFQNCPMEIVWKQLPELESDDWLMAIEVSRSKEMVGIAFGRHVNVPSTQGGRFGVNLIHCVEAEIKEVCSTGRLLRGITEHLGSQKIDGFYKSLAREASNNPEPNLSRQFESICSWAEHAVRDAGPLPVISGESELPQAILHDGWGAQCIAWQMVAIFLDDYEYDWTAHDVLNSEGRRKTVIGVGRGREIGALDEFRFLLSRLGHSANLSHSIGMEIAQHFSQIFEAFTGTVQRSLVLKGTQSADTLHATSSSTATPSENTSLDEGGQPSSPLCLSNPSGSKLGQTDDQPVTGGFWSFLFGRKRQIAKATKL